MRVDPVAGATLGATVTGIDLSRVGDGEWAAILAALNAHAVLVFPAQHRLTDAAQDALGRRLGRFIYRSLDMTNRPTPGRAEIHVDAWKWAGIQRWHADNTYGPVAARASMLYAKVVPPEGGGTEFADMRAAYDALSPAMRARVAGLTAFHSNEVSTARGGEFPEELRDAVPARRPLVAAHPATGRRALAVGNHAFAVAGLRREEGERLLAALVDWACRPPRVYAHRWAPGDLVLWDNRCVLHRGRPYDASHPRVLRGTRIAGDPRADAALPATDGGEAAAAARAEMVRLRALGPARLRAARARLAAAGGELGRDGGEWGAAPPLPARL